MALTKNVYHLPFRKSDLIKAHSDPRGHFAHFKHAIDFLLPEGTVILAPKDGVVVDIKVDSNEGGLDPKYNDMKFINSMTLEHSNGEYSQYVHLKHKGALVKLGDEVKTGQPVALSGNTGWTTEPHLHFHVIKHNQKENRWKTLEIRFKEKVDVDRTQEPIPKEFEKTMRELDKYRKKLPKEIYFPTPFKGTINAVSMIFDPKSLVLILPTNEKDKVAQKRIHKYVKSIRDSTLKNASIITDTKALKRDLSTNSIFAYGTLKGNLWIVRHLSDLPIRIQENGIKGDTWYSGRNIRFITAWPNPYNSERGVVVYTAQRAEDIVNIHSVFHGPTDYVVALEREVLKAGSYNKQNDKWSFNSTHQP